MVPDLWANSEVGCEAGTLLLGRCCSLCNSWVRQRQLGITPPPHGYAIGVVTVTSNLPKQPSRTALDKVDWDSGWGPKERASGLPNPKGW